MDTQYTINLNKEGKGSVTIVENGEVKTFTSADPNFPHIVAAAKAGKSLREAEVYRIPKNLTKNRERIVAINSMSSPTTLVFLSVL